MLETILKAAIAFRTDRDLDNGQAWSYNHGRLAELGVIDMGDIELRS
jgi:hypothetical protein